MDFEIIGEITDIETIARGKGVRNRVRLQMKIKGKQLPQFGLCLNNEGYLASLEIG